MFVQVCVFVTDNIKHTSLRRHDTQHNDTQHKGLFATFSITTFSIMTISITMLCHYAECRILFNIMLDIVMLGVVTPSLQLSIYCTIRVRTVLNSTGPRPVTQVPANTTWGERLSTVNLLMKVAYLVKKENNISNKRS